MLYGLFLQGTSATPLIGLAGNVHLLCCKFAKLYLYHTLSRLSSSDSVVAKTKECTFYSDTV